MANSDHSGLESQKRASSEHNSSSENCLLHIVLVSRQDVSQDLETGCLKLAIVKIFGCPNF